MRCEKQRKHNGKTYFFRDAQHLQHAMKAMEQGYDLLLEKPISNKLDACIALTRATEHSRTLGGGMVEIEKFAKSVGANN